ncbi:HyaD/HybD family hydrogenase maturation endopeptidase [Xylanimonas ulmi]|uniref:Hydrogenase maturation protease n=1 Tax=Xylanimonas ulmi TaxID=228973 RepID=A0A4Q7M9C6_9MICO|nr:HyaD/HybD family hydrogenase maturation endopeptidase [Xylanibacterium ulmi]RZS62819.1 hydrogenase maturation protease [Xylanibacterium ulmi]
MAATITVLGIGNPIMADDGVGLALIAYLSRSVTDPRVQIIDGGTGGMELVPVVQDSERLLVLDAVAGPEPGTVVLLTGDQVPRLLASKLSPHQVGLLDVLSVARLLGREPREVVIVGIVPEVVDLRFSLSDVVTEALDEAAAMAYEVVEHWLAEADYRELDCVTQRRWS